MDNLFQQIYYQPIWNWIYYQSLTYEKSRRQLYSQNRYFCPSACKQEEYYCMPIRIVFNKQTTPINATFPAKVPCKVKTTAQTYIWFSNSDWIILALGNCEDPQKITKKICSFDSLAGTNKRTPLPASFRFWWRTQLNPMNAYQTRKYLRLFDVLLACTLWDFQNRIVIGHVFV